MKKWVCKRTGTVFNETERKPADFGTHETIELVSLDETETVRVSSFNIHHRFGPEAAEPEEVA
jgi:hypothetical protein